MGETGDKITKITFYQWD